MSVDEKLKFVEKWSEEIRKQKANLLFTVVTTSTSVPHSLRLAKECERLGVDAIAVLPPLYYKPNSVEEMISYFKLFADAAPNTPLLYYHIPMMININGKLQKIINFRKYFNQLTHTFCALVDVVQLIDEAVKRVPTLSGMKFSDANFLQLTYIQNQHKKHFKVFCGLEEVSIYVTNQFLKVNLMILTFQMLLAAFTGLEINAAICATINLPELSAAYKALRAAVKRSDLQQGRLEQEKITNKCISFKKTGKFSA